MTKAQLLAEMSAIYTSIDTPRFIDTSKNANWYIIKVLMTGLSGSNKKPTAYIKTVSFYVYKEGTGEESADYGEKEPSNDANLDITSDDSLLSITKMYKALFLKDRVQAAVVKEAQSILDENLYTINLATNAGIGQKTVVLDTGGGVHFWRNKIVILSDTVASEENTVESVSGDTITMLSALSNTYTTTNQAKMTYKTNIERLRWAANALVNPEYCLNAMLGFVTIDSTVQAAGGLVSDSAINSVVQSHVNNLAAVISC